MLEQLRRTLRRRDRLVHIRRIQQDQAQQALATLLREQEELQRAQQTYEAAQTEAHRSLLGRFEDPTPVRGEDLAQFTRQIERLSLAIRGKEREIEALQPPIRERREEVVVRYKKRRSMEILKESAQERVVHEELKREQASLDESTSQRHGRGGNNGQTA